MTAQTEHDCKKYLQKGNCAACGKNFPVTSAKIAEAFGEPLYSAHKTDGKYFIDGYIDRKAAERPENPIRHLTVIIVPFVADGADKGDWLVIDRTARQWAKGAARIKSPSYNFIGGHVKADLKDESLIGSEVARKIFDETALIELSEELWINSGQKETLLEVWENGADTKKTVGVAQYSALPLIPIGITEFESETNYEFSFVYALPVPSADLPNLAAADDYGAGKHIYLPLFAKNETELLKVPYVTYLPDSKPNGEICDAITRLWENKNKEVYDKLIEAIKNYITNGAD